MTNQETLAKASKELMLKEPFYGLLLMSLNKVWRKDIPTAGVRVKDISYELAINPDFWESLEPNMKIGVLKHELLHIGFFHLTNYEHLRNKTIRNIAMDLEINQYIEEQDLPEGVCKLSKFPDLNLEPKKGTFYYYDKLMSDNSKAQSTVKCIMEVGQDEQQDEQQGNTTCELPNGEEIEIPDHTLWDEIEDLPEATKRLLENQTKHILEQVADQIAKMKGDIPGEFAEIIERLKIVEPPKFDWKGYLRRFAGKSTRIYTKKSRRKLNKRLEENPGLKFKRHKHILAAIDTSGSVSTSELKEFIQEMTHLEKTGSDVTLIECDVSISYVGKFNSRKDVEIHGRGGTEFQPVIDYFNEHNPKYSCLFYFTDGECPAPENVPKNTVWVISSRGNGDHLKETGKVIKLED
jgi:predicted metal-dependent peptidase